ncbi:MAG: VOC family protein [Hyphomicrobiaceae bacterium]|nr:MAG: VOC family protein [Hyphomicrobiaceae bacterium]
MQPRLSLITLGVSDVGRSRKFYETLGFVASSAGNEDVAFFPAGGVVLALYGRTALARDAGVSESTPGAVGVSLAHNVRTESEVSAVLQEAAAAGGRVIKSAHKVFWGGTVGYFTDPDGHMWEVAHNPDFPLDQEGRVMLPPPKAAP